MYYSRMPSINIPIQSLMGLWEGHDTTYVVSLDGKELIPGPSILVPLPAWKDGPPPC